MSDIATQLGNFIAEQIFMDPERVPAPDDDLLLSGQVDSLGVMRIVFFMEQELGKSVPFTDITIEHFSSIGAMCRYLESG